MSAVLEQRATATQQVGFDQRLAAIELDQNFERRLQVAAELGRVAVAAEISEARLETELESEFIEAFKQQFITRYELSVVDGRVVDQDGRPMVTFIGEDYRQARDYAAANPSHAFYVERARADFDNAWAVDQRLMSAQTPPGSTWLRFSPFPEGQDPQAVRERFYREDSRRCLIWLQRKLDDDTLELTSIAVDHKDFEQIRRKFIELGGAAEPAQSSEQLPHQTLESVMSVVEFEQLTAELKSWAGLDSALDSLEALRSRGGDVVSAVKQQYQAIERAESWSDVPAAVLATAQSMHASASPRGLRLNGIDPEVLARLIEARAYGPTEAKTLQQVVKVAGFAALQRIMNTGDDQRWRSALSQQQLLQSSGRIHINNLDEMYGCAGGLAAQFAPGRTHNLENWGKDTGPGVCKNCHEHKEERGGCEVCVDCHIKLQTKQLTLAA